MDIKTIIIIALIAFMIYWYTNDSGARNLMDQGVDKAKSIVGMGDAKSTCESNYDPVCASGKTIMNMCYAKAQGITDYIAGACP